MKPQITTHIWLGLPIEVRRQLVATFSIQRSEGSHIQDNVVISDGYNHRDLSVVTVERMQEYLHSKESDFFKLFQEVLDELPILHEEPEPPKPTPEVKVTIEVDGKTFRAAEVETPKKPVVKTEAPIKKRKTK